MQNTALARNDHEKLILKLTPGILTIGSAADNDIVLSDPEVSEYQAQVMTSVHISLLTDLSSTRGTFLNGKRVIKHSLKNGDIVRFGQTEFIVSGIPTV